MPIYRRCLSPKKGLFISLTILLCILLLYFSALDVLELMELRLLDIRMRLRGPKDPGNLVKLVLIDSASRAQYGLDADFRLALAGVLDQLCSQGARAIGLDFFFVPNISMPFDETRQRLAEAVKRCDNVVMGFNINYDLDHNRLAGAEAAGRRKLLLATRDASDVDRFIPEQMPEEALVPEPLIAHEAAAMGYFSIIADPDQIARKVSAVLSNRNLFYYPFSLAVVRTYLRQKQSGLIADHSDKSISGPQLGSITLAPDAYGNLWLNFYGPASSFKYTSFRDAVAQGVTKDFAEGAIILMGVSGEGSKDLFDTTFDRNMPGVAVHATAVANALSNGFLVRSTGVRAIEVVILVVSSLLMGLFLPRVTPILALFVGPLLALVLWLISEKILLPAGIWLHLITPFLLLVFSYLGLIVARMRAAEIQAAQIEHPRP